MSPVNLLPGAISEMLASITDTNRIAKADRYGLLAALLDDTLSEEDRCSIDRLLRALRRGRIEIVEELSIIG